MIAIRTATPDDVALILGLVRELAVYEREPDAVVATEAMLHKALFETRVAESLIAELEGKAVGFALFFHNFSTWTGKPGIYLEDLYVTPDAQSLYDMLFVVVRAKFALLGIGELMLALLAWRGTLVAKLTAVPLAAGGLVSLWFLLSQPHHPWMMQAHSYGWMALLALAVVGAINPRWVRRA